MYIIKLIVSKFIPACPRSSLKKDENLDLKIGIFLPVLPVL